MREPAQENTHTVLQMLHMRPIGLRDVPWFHCNSSRSKVTSGSWPESSGSLGRKSGDGSASVSRHNGHLRIFENMFPPRSTGPFSTKSLGGEEEPYEDAITMSTRNKNAIKHARNPIEQLAILNGKTTKLIQTT